MPPIVTSSSRRRARRASPSFPWATVACAVALAAALLAMRLLRGGGGATTNDGGGAATAMDDGVGAVATTNDAIATANVAVAATNAVSEAKAPTRRLYNGKEVVSSSVRTNRNGDVVEKVVLADGTKASIVSPRPPVFSNVAEQVIALALSTPQGESMPPLPDMAGLDEEFRKALAEPIVINEDDSDEVKALKERVAETKEYLAAELEKGGTVAGILKEHQAEMERIGAAQLEAIREIQAIRAERGEAAAAAYAEKANEAFREEGIPELPARGAAAEEKTEEAQ